MVYGEDVNNAKGYNKMTPIKKITDAHRIVVTNYYGRLLKKYGSESLLRHIPKLKTIVWSEHGIKMIEQKNAK
jgi:hypothetical protein